MNLNRQNVCFDANYSYVLAGGLGGLGRSIARRLVNNGAKHLIFLSRSGLIKPEAKKLVQELTSAGASIASFACDLTDEKSVKAIAEDCTRDLPPICGVIQGAMVLQVTCSISSLPEANSLISSSGFPLRKYDF